MLNPLSKEVRVHRLPEARVLLDGLAYVESPRWHDSRLWFAHWGTGEIVAVDLDGNSEVTGQGPPIVNASAPGHSLGWSFACLPDRRLLVTGKELLRLEPDGSMVRHADLTGIGEHGWNEIVVDGRGNIYLTASASASSPASRPDTGSSPWSPRTARRARSRRNSSSPTAWW
jgi:sugar lactone lactonase YvrE